VEQPWLLKVMEKSDCDDDVVGYDRSKNCATGINEGVMEEPIVMELKFMVDKDETE